MANITEEDIKLAQQVQAQYGVPTSVTLAQYGLESGWGKSTVGNNNYFNIKGNGTGGYRDYNSKAESFMDYGKLLSSERYTSQTSGATNVQEYVQGVKNGGYAEDPKYVEKVMGVINSNNLTSYDMQGSAGGIGGFIANGVASGTVGNAITDNGIKWWGDIVIVVFTVILIIGGVLFLAFAVLENTSVSDKVSKAKKLKKAVT